MANAFQTVANMTSVVKDEWTSQEVAVQFYNKNPLLAMFRAFPATVIGLQAQVPIQKYLPGGYSTTDAAGGSINDASPAGTAQAQYTLVYHWFQMALETGALNQTATNAQAVISSKDLEMKGSIDAVSRQCSRQLASDGTGFIAAALGSGGAQTVFQLDPAGYGYDAIARGWLYPGLKVDIGTVADSDTVTTDNIILDVGESPTNPTITLTSSATQAASTFVSIANPNSATTPGVELNGLRNIVSQSTVLGGINPATAGNGYWKSPLVDTTNTVLSLDLILNLRRATRQKTGDPAGLAVMSLKQEQNLYSLLRNQVRFSSDGSMSAGDNTGVSWSGMQLMSLPDIVDRNLYVVNKSDFVRITGDITEPTWVTDLEGAGGSFRWAQGKTNFVNGLVFPFQVGIQRRNSMAAATNLTA